MHTLLRPGCPCRRCPQRCRGTPRWTPCWLKTVCADEHHRWVNIGISGSDLGPKWPCWRWRRSACRASVSISSPTDGHELCRVLRAVRPRAPCSDCIKAFTTQRPWPTPVRRWWLGPGWAGRGRHFVGLTSNVQTARTWNITTTLVWDWVGGRYSLWSAIGLPIAIAIGSQVFAPCPGPMPWIHFRQRPCANLPVRLALLDIWYRTSTALAAAASPLPRLRAWQRIGSRWWRTAASAWTRPGTLPMATSPVLWANRAAKARLLQMLHQGTDVLPLEIVTVRRCAPSAPPPHHAG